MSKNQQKMSMTENKMSVPINDGGAQLGWMKSVVWQTGMPDVRSGGREAFWCAVRRPDGKLRHRHLVYLNGHVMGLADSCYDVPASAVPIDEDSDEYAWTGWHEESCDQCETLWAFEDEVVAWMRLPKFEGGAK